MNNPLYHEFFTVKDEKEMSKRYNELLNKGYNPFEIYCFRYQGNDGLFHREIFVFNRDDN